jgi:hypothetical protein
LRKVNIGSVENPKIASIGDYWDKQAIDEVHNLLWEYEDMFPKTFSEIKGIKGAMGEMKIELKLVSRPVKHIPYCLKPRIKENVKKEVDKMLGERLIFPIEEEKWIIPIVVQSKKGT